jgi:ATP-dependent protease ClpP protease subunit
MFSANFGRPKSAASFKRFRLEEETDNEEYITENIKVQDNNIYFFGPVDMQNMLELTINIDILTKQLQIFAINFQTKSPPINIFINSEGGEVHAALSVFDTIKANPVHVNTIITGNASSAATIISMAGHTRKITENAYMLIHNISSTFWGKMHEFEDEMKNMAKLTKNLKEIYKSHSSITKKQLDDLLKKDLLMDSTTCLRLGFVDEII